MMMLIAKHIFPVLMTLLSSTFVCPFYISVYDKMLRKCSYVLANDVVVNFVDIRLQLLLDPSSLAQLHTTWSQEMTEGSAWHNCGSCCKEKLEKLFLKKPSV